ncbi:CheR family methyltransferase [Singulisphaera sp. Ch08]|uniref:protein-glutamate O-methyltransferase n=1 Tax=Singulisphaera sp. Ch08 TaxID=3120278 RepID=A0AAU7CJI0_9BACT
MTGTAGELTEGEYDRFCKLIYRVAGIRIPGTKRVMVATRVRKRLRATGISSFSAYLSFLHSAAGAGEMPLFIDVMTTNETYFYRDPQHYDWFDQTFLPEVIQRARLRKRPRSLRVWSAASSTGEELYSIALKVNKHRRELAGWKLTLLGTDLSGAVLEAARAGVYDDRALHLVGEAERRDHFTHDPVARTWTLGREVKTAATFRPHNLLEPLNEEPFDCIFIKNVLIYFDAVSKQTVVQHLLAALAKGGYLVVGPSEGIYGMLGALTKHNSWLYQKPA